MISFQLNVISLVFDSCNPSAKWPFLANKISLLFRTSRRIDNIIFGQNSGIPAIVVTPCLKISGDVLSPRICLLMSTMTFNIRVPTIELRLKYFWMWLFQSFFTFNHTVGKTVTKKKFWILDFTRFYCPSEFSGL